MSMVTVSITWKYLHYLIGEIDMQIQLTIYCDKCCDRDECHRASETRPINELEVLRKFLQSI